MEYFSFQCLEGFFIISFLCIIFSIFFLLSQKRLILDTYDNRTVIVNEVNKLRIKQISDRCIIICVGQDFVEQKEEHIKDGLRCFLNVLFTF